MTPIVMTENYWANTQLSIVRYTGSIKIWGKQYVIVDKHGRDIYECTEDSIREGRDKAIEPGEPCDLCREDFVPLYRELGRSKFLQFLSENPDVTTVKRARELIIKQYTNESE